MPDQPPAGWYPDPLHNKPKRYWDGTQWDRDEHASSLVVVGYLAAILFPIVGLILGVVAGTRTDDPRTRVHGPYIVLLSVLCGVFWALVLLSRP